MKSNGYFEDSSRTSNHCLRRNGTERGWFPTREEAEHFAASPANPAYHSDIAHDCAKCGFYHLSRPEWLEPKFTSADLQMLEDVGIETPNRLDEHFRCCICGFVMRDGISVRSHLIAVGSPEPNPQSNGPGLRRSSTFLISGENPKSPEFNTARTVPK